MKYEIRLPSGEQCLVSGFANLPTNVSAVTCYPSANGSLTYGFKLVKDDVLGETEQGIALEDYTDENGNTWGAYAQWNGSYVLQLADGKLTFTQTKYTGEGPFVSGMAVPFTWPTLNCVLLRFGDRL